MLKIKRVRLAMKLWDLVARLCMFYGRVWSWFHGRKFPSADADSRLKLRRSLGL